MLNLKYLGSNKLKLERTWLLAIVLGSLLSGIFMGWLGVKTLPAQQIAIISQEVHNLLELLQSNKPINNLFNEAVIKQEVWLLKVFFLGTSCIGLPLIMTMIFTKGFGLGYTIGVILSSFSKGKAFLMILTGVLPHNLLGIPLCLIATYISANLSLDILELIRKNVNLAYNPFNLKLGFTLIMMLLISLGVAAIEGFISPLLISLLHF